MRRSITGWLLSMVIMFMLWVYDGANTLVYSAWGTLAGGNLIIHSR
jgi:hypothetical protein